MNQPPHSRRPPDWRRPRGVAPGTWDYVNERSIADHYDAFVADTPLCDLDAKILAEHLPALDGSDNQVVLDLGCGTGRSALSLAERGYRVVGVDLSQAMLEQLTSKANERDLSINVVRANLVELDCIAGNTVDHAICMFSTLGMIQGKANRRRMLADAARIVRPAGLLIVHVHHRWAAVCEPSGIRKLASSWWNSFGSSEHEFGDTVYSYRGLDKMFMHRFSRGEIQRVLCEAGWQVQQLLRVSIDGAAIAKPTSIAGGFIVIAQNR